MGMNIDIASIDMVSEVNMVSIVVYGCVSADRHVGRRKEEGASQWGWGVHECGWSEIEGCGLCFGIHCLRFQNRLFLVPKDFSNLVQILETWHKMSKMRDIFASRTQSRGGDPLQKPYFLRFTGKPSSSSDFLDLGWRQRERARF